MRYCRRIRRAAREGAAIEARSGTILLLAALIPLGDAASAQGPSPPSPLLRIRRQYQIFVRIGGRQMYLWRAEDAEGEVLDVLLQAKRDTKAARKLMSKLLKKQGMAPDEWVTDKSRP